MVEEAQKLKNVRKTRLAAFTRKRNSLSNLLDGIHTLEKLDEVLVEVKQAFQAVERAHERYAEVVAEEVLDTEGDFLLTPSVALDEVEVRMAVRVKVLRSQEAKERLKQGVNGFAAPSKLILELCEAKEISMKDMRLELDKLETTYNGLQAELTLLDAGDHAELLAKYNKEVVDEYEKVRRSGLKYLNSEPTRPTIEPTDTEDGIMTVATRSAGFSTTKRETVMLPKFCGDESPLFFNIQSGRSNGLCT